MDSRCYGHESGLLFPSRRPNFIVRACTRYNGQRVVSLSRLSRVRPLAKRPLNLRTLGGRLPDIRQYFFYGTKG